MTDGLERLWTPWRMAYVAGPGKPEGCPFCDPDPDLLVARGQRVVLMTDARSGGLASTVFAGRERYVIRGAGIAGRGFWRGARMIGGADATLDSWSAPL